MAEKESRSISTLNEFLEWAGQFNDGQYLFRGVKSETYEMEASACRRLPPEHKGNPSRLLRINERLIEDARNRGHDQKDGRTLSHLELLAELQHFGAATCLMDFSRSALIALWFACESGTRKENGVNGKVFAVRRDIWLKTVNSDLIQEPIDHFFQVDQRNRYQLYQWEPKFQNNRILAQHSVFVFGGAEVEVEEKCVIVAGSKRSILKSLNDISDVTEASMYPDFDGFARLHAYNKPYTEPDVQTYLQRGIEAHQRGKMDSAAEYYAHIISLDPLDTSILVYAYYNRGLINTQKGSYDYAIEDYNEAIKQSPNFADAYYHRGWTYGQMENYDNAITDHSRAIELKPDYAYAYYSRGWAYGQKEDYDRAIADHSRAIELKPDYAYAYYSRGWAYGKKGDYDRAIADHSTAIELQPNYADAYHNRGWAYANNNYHNRAIMDYGIAIQLRPTFSISYCNRGLAWLHLANWNNARSDLTTARNMGMDIATTFCNLYRNVSNFERTTNLQLPADIAAMLTPPAG